MNREWWRWYLYKYSTWFKLWFMKYRLYWPFMWLSGGFWEMCRYYNSMDITFQDKNIQRNFNSMENKTKLWEFIDTLNDMSWATIHFFEFGVYKGASLKWWAENHSSGPWNVFYGFDSFKGLPEKFQNFGHGFLDTDGEVPNINDTRVELVVGLFQTTINLFIDLYIGWANSPKCVDHKRIFHFDADVYSGTMYALMKIERILRIGDIIIFDEFAHPKHEYKAWRDFLHATGIEAKCIGATDVFYHVAFQIMEMP